MSKLWAIQKESSDFCQKECGGWGCSELGFCTKKYCVKCFFYPNKIS